MKKFIKIFTAAVLAAGMLFAEDSVRPKTVAGFGSSVCCGAGDSADGGYIARLQKRLEQDGWSVLNVSRGGDNTVKIQERWEPLRDESGNLLPEQKGPFLLPENPAYVLVGLSLGNEGFKDEQFRTNLLGIIEKCRANGMTVAVGGCYAHGLMTETPYARTRKTNLFIGQLNVPSVNFLGSIDDGAGRWVSGLWNDPYHPNTQGHEEMFHAIVPSLWPALEQGKPLPVRQKSEGMALTDGRMLEFVPDDPVHAFFEVFWIRNPADGVVATVNAEPVNAIDSESPWNHQMRPERRFVPTGESVQVSLSVQDGRILYSGLDDGTISAMLSNDWNMVALSHWYARGETELFVNEARVGSLRERYIPSRFSLGNAEFKEWFVYRSALNSDEVALIADCGMFRSSLEVYVPLNDGMPESGLLNRARSLSSVRFYNPSR